VTDALAAWRPSPPMSPAEAAAVSTCHRWRWCIAEHTSPPWERNEVVAHRVTAARSDLVIVLVTHDARDDRPKSRAETEDPYVSLNIGGEFLRMTMPVAARFRDTLDEAAGGSGEWLAGPLSQALSLLALGPRSSADDRDVARVAERIPGLSRRRAAHLLDRWQLAAAPGMSLLDGESEPPGLPAAAELIALVRAQGPASLDVYAPAIDAPVDVAGAASWLGRQRDSISRDRSRRLADGTPRWPRPDYPSGRSGSWRYRTIVMHLAALPGRGSAGRGRPAAARTISRLR
jgi:hypothetical protein